MSLLRRSSSCALTSSLQQKGMFLAVDSAWGTASSVSSIRIGSPTIFRRVVWTSKTLENSAFRAANCRRRCPAEGTPPAGRALGIDGGSSPGGSASRGPATREAVSRAAGMDRAPAAPSAGARGLGSDRSKVAITARTGLRAAGGVTAAAGRFCSGRGGEWLTICRICAGKLVGSMPSPTQSCQDSSGLCSLRITETSTVLMTSPSCRVTLPVPIHSISRLSAFSRRVAGGWRSALRRPIFSALRSDTADVSAPVSGVHSVACTLPSARSSCRRTRGVRRAGQPCCNTSDTCRLPPASLPRSGTVSVRTTSDIWWLSVGDRARARAGEEEQATRPRGHMTAKCPIWSHALHLRDTAGHGVPSGWGRRAPHLRQAGAAGRTRLPVLVTLGLRLPGLIARLRDRR